jgi:hypothetical protein
MVRNNKALGVGLDANAVGALTDVTLDNNGWGNFSVDAEGLLVAGDAVVAMKGGAILNSRLWGVSVRSPTSGGATLTLDGVDIHDNGLHGLRIVAAKEVSVLGGALRNHPGGAALALEGAGNLSVKGALLEKNSTGVLDLLPQNIPSTTLSFKQCIFRQNEGSGLRLRHPALQPSLMGCLFDKNNASGDPGHADLLLERPAQSGSSPVVLADLTFDGAVPGLKGGYCGAAANLSLGGKARLLNLSDGCVFW